jgi:hypothetical protein
MEFPAQTLKPRPFRTLSAKPRVARGLTGEQGKSGASSVDSNVSPDDAYDAEPIAQP